MPRTIFIFFCFTFVTGCCAFAQPLTPGVAQRIDSLFAEWNSPTSPGCMVGIVRDGAFIYQHGFGMADIEHHIPLSERTVFNLASTSKQFTAACILLLAQQKKLSLDDDVRKYIPELPDYGTTITIRELLNHTSGLRDYITLLYFSGVRVEDRCTVSDAFDIIRRQKGLNFTPGTEWSYSNSGYFLAGKIIERVSGEPIGEFAGNMIFGPLWMNHTRWVGDPTAILGDRAESYASSGKHTYNDYPSGWELLGDGGVWTTMDDLRLWDNNFYNPVIGGNEMIQQLTSDGALVDGTNDGYGLGLFLETYHGLRVVRHEGEWAGYKSEMMRFPGQHLTVIILANCSSIVPTPIARSIADILLSKEMNIEKSIQPVLPGPGPESVLTPGQAGLFTGFYRNPADETIRRIDVQNGHLQYVRVPGAASDLRRIDGQTFMMMGVPATVRIAFTPGSPTKEAEMSVVVDSGKPLLFTRFKPVRLTRQQLAEYAGTYLSDELGAEYRVASRDSELVVSVRRFDDMPLSSTTTDVFKFKDFRSFTFHRDAELHVTGFSMSAARSRNILFYRVTKID